MTYIGFLHKMQWSYSRTPGWTDWLCRIQKELVDLQRRISCLTVAENSSQLAVKRDRLAIELRYAANTAHLLDNSKGH